MKLAVYDFALDLVISAIGRVMQIFNLLIR